MHGQCPVQDRERCEATLANAPIALSNLLRRKHAEILPLRPKQSRRRALLLLLPGARTTFSFLHFSSLYPPPPDQLPSSSPANAMHTASAGWEWRVASVRAHCRRGRTAGPPLWFSTHALRREKKNWLLLYRQLDFHRFLSFIRSCLGLFAVHACAP